MIQIEHLTKTFNVGTINAVAALRDLSLTLADGEFVTVIGSNGAGKSSLLNSIAGAQSVEQGRIVIDGHDVTHWAEHQRARWIGRVFQNPFDGTAAAMSVEQNLTLAYLRGKPHRLMPGVTRARRDLFRRELAALGLGLEQRMETRVSLLSGGQRQALTLLMATLAKPRLLLLDEHTAALDPSAAAQVMQLTERLVRDNQLTTLMITHNMAQALACGDRTLMMHQGQFILDMRGAERQHLTVQDLVNKFAEMRKEVVDDELLLSGN
ncbi:MAG: ATP-binding cassette domain-containing protein, partial [Chloroflexota bacterium]